MERLTVKVDEFFAPKKLCTVNRYEEVDDCDSCIDCCKQHGEGSNTCNGCPVQECFDRLGEYEDLEEQGLLLKLPCKIGDIVYIVEIDENKSISDTLKWKISEKKFVIRYLDYINESVFLTRSAAEKALRKANGIE